MARRPAAAPGGRRRSRDRAPVRSSSWRSRGVGGISRREQSAARSFLWRKTTAGAHRMPRIHGDATPSTPRRSPADRACHESALEDQNESLPRPTRPLGLEAVRRQTSSRRWGCRSRQRHTLRSATTPAAFMSRSWAEDIAARLQESSEAWWATGCGSAYQFLGQIAHRRGCRRADAVSRPRGLAGHAVPACGPDARRGPNARRPHDGAAGAGGEPVRVNAFAPVDPNVHVMSVVPFERTMDAPLAQPALQRLSPEPVWCGGAVPCAASASMR